MVCSSGSIIWCLYFRSVTRLLQTIESMKRDQGTIRVLGPRDGKDFLFLFDLLSHTCGLESTLRVLTHSGEVTRSRECSIEIVVCTYREPASPACTLHALENQFNISIP